MAQIKIKLIRSRIGLTPHQRKMLDALGLRKLNKEKLFTKTPAIEGIVKKIPHLVVVEKV